MNEIEIVIDIYINSLKMLQRLIYSKEPLDKDNKVSVENIVNLRYINSKKKKHKKKEFIMNIENISKICKNPEEILKFESRFESGNLQLAYFTPNIDSNDDIDKYEIFLQNDTNTIGYTQWFFFRISNTKKNKTVNLSIMNMLRKKTKYSNGIKIWCYSKKNCQNNKIGWYHTKESVQYYKNFLYKLNKGKRNYYYTLSFNYTFEYDDDEVFFANCIPFTYTDLNRDLNEYTKEENEKYLFYSRKKLCSTIIGNEVEYLTINNSNTNFLNNDYTQNKNNKKGVVLLARQHPSESVGSWTIKGAIDFLMSENDEAKYLRDNFVFKIIPMINVDGVISGNTRTSLAGCDLNRRWIYPNSFLHPEIFYGKKLIVDFSENYKIECIVDFHGHFGAFNSFFYANKKKDDISFCRYFPFSCAKKSKVIQIEKSKFKMPEYKKGTGRINLFNELNVENVVTLETSYFGCNAGGYINQYFTVETLKEIGRDICNGILLFHYHSNLKQGINNNFNDYPLLEKKIENDEKKINEEFTEYINTIKNKEEKNNNSNNNTISNTINNTLSNNTEFNSNNLKTNPDYDSDDEDDDDDPNDDVSESESEPSGDNLDEKEIIKYLHVNKNIKKINKKKQGKFFQKTRNLSKLVKNNTNKNTEMDSNQLLSSKKTNNFINGKNNNQDANLLYLPKINNIMNNNSDSKDKNNSSSLLLSESLNKNTIKKINKNVNNKYNNESSIKNKYSSIFNNNNDVNLKIVSLEGSSSAKNIFKNKPKICFEIYYKEGEVNDYTQTEEIFFKKHWSYFLGKYKILSATTSDIIPLPMIYRLPPPKMSNFKSNNNISNSTKKENSVLLIPQEVNYSKSHCKNKINTHFLNVVKIGKYDFNYQNMISNKGINVYESGNNLHKNSVYLSNLKMNNIAVNKSQNIVFKKLGKLNDNK